MMAYNSHFHGMYLGTYFQTQRRVRGWLLNQQHITSDMRIKLFSHFGEGLFESLLSLSQMFSNKKKIAIINGQSPLVKIPQSWFLINKFEVKNFNWMTTSTQKEEVFNFDPAIIIIPRDHILTGEKVNLEWLDVFKNKRVGIVTWSHFQELNFSWISDWPYAIHLHCLGSYHVMGAFGSRVEFNHLISSHAPQNEWSTWEGCLQKLQIHTQESFEIDKELKWGLTPFKFSKNSELSFQKVCFINNNSKKFEFKKLAKEKAEKYKYEKLSLCSLGVTEEELSWMNPKLSNEEINDLIIRVLIE